jgi:hypothetical protein
LLILGEVRTGMLQNSGALRRPAVTELLRLIPGERVTLSERPVAHAVSPAQLTGVDCSLPTASHIRCRGVGTVSAHAVVMGGRAVQGCAHVEVRRGGGDRRHAWSHYLGMPGVVETLSGFDDRDVAVGHLMGADPDCIDLGAITARLMTSVQISPLLDHATPLRAKRTRLRWAATTADGERPRAEFTVVDDVIRTLRITVQPGMEEQVAGFCENLALHDWALTTLLTIVERSKLGSPEMAVDRLRPVVDHLLHLWMPGAHVGSFMLPLWSCLEERPGFTKQWLATVARIRDQLALRTLIALQNS